MQRFLKNLLPGLAVAAFAPAALGFSLMGPPLAWQTTAWGYNDTVGDVLGGMRIAPMPLNAFYRLNITNITYAFDESFIRYFGANGMKAVDDAFAILNAVPAADTINLDDYANNTRLNNLQAAQAGLMDVKSYTLETVFSYLGAAEPEINVWTIRDVRQDPLNPARTNFYILQRNYDPYTLLPSSYVNGVLYTYRNMWVQNWRFNGGAPYLDAVEFPANLNNDQPYRTVAGRNLNGGEFYTGLSRDDMGCLKYLLSTNTLAVEGLFPGVTASSSQFSVVGGWIGWMGNNAGTNNVFLLNSNSAYFVTPSTLAALNGSNFVTVGIRGGRQKISFTKVQYDSILGTGFVAVTNTFMDEVIVTNKLVTQKVQRIITQPDIIFRATDLNFWPDGTLVASTISNPTFVDDDALNGGTVEGGPGLVTGLPFIITYTTLTPGLFNYDPYFLDEQTSTASFRWASFDNTPTPPFIYPDGPNRISIDELLNLVGSYTNTIR